MPRRKKRKFFPRSKHFPNITRTNHSVTSQQDDKYNCIAYAAGIKNKHYWPDNAPFSAWPSGITNTETMQAFIEFYQLFGYSVVTDATGGVYEKGFEQIA